MGSKEVSTKMVQRKGLKAAQLKAANPEIRNKPVWLWRADHLNKQWRVDLECLAAQFADPILQSPKLII